MMPNEERKNIKKIIRAVEDIEGVTIQPETLRHKLKGFYHALKAKFISDEPKKLEEDNIQANQKREAEKTAKTERKQHFTSKKLPKAIKENAKTFRISLTRFSGYVRGENPLVTQAKINKIQNANFVPKVKVNEQAALKKASSTPKEQDTPIK